MRVNISIDGGTPMRRRARSVLVANTGRLQAGVRLLRKAEPDDGVLDVAVLAPDTLRHWLAMAASVLVRRRKVPHMEIFTARSVYIHATRPQPRQLDGDVIGTDHDLSIEVLPQALLVCVPQ